MNKWFLLLIAIGLGFTGWYRRETISGWFGHKTTEEAAPDVGPGNPGSHGPTPVPTPNLALASLDQAKRTYPALNIPGSAFRTRFEADYNTLKGSNPGFLAQDNWPLLLAERTAKQLGGGVLPVVGLATPVPIAHLSGGALDGKPGKANAATPTPAFTLPGLKGSALDQKPSGGKGGH